MCTGMACDTHIHDIAGLEIDLGGEPRAFKITTTVVGGKEQINRIVWIAGQTWLLRRRQGIRDRR